MKRKVLSWYGLTVFSVFLLAVFWEFFLEDMVPGRAPEATAQRWEYVFTSLFFAALSLVVPAILCYKSFLKKEMAEKELKEGFEMIKRIFRNAHDAIVTIDDKDVVTMWNHKAQSLFGWSWEEAAGRNIADLIIPPGYHEAHKKGLRRYLATGKESVLNQNLELPARHKNGKEFPIELTVSVNVFEDRQIFTGIIRDITERKALEEELRKLSTQDSLTGVANRRNFDQILQKEWDRASRNQKPLSLLMLDIDFFKNYNDTYGHQAGDRCLQQVAKAIVKSLQRPADQAARYGGEEFAVILPDTKENGALAIGEKIRANIEALGLEHKQNKVNSYVTASLGCSTINPHRDCSPAELLKAADTALYQAKKQNRNRVFFLM